ncbi:MAG: hypothetical protein JOZ81_16600 [Chloroflexi bacterium]|nr:hypothetical protein [Chloroflexota bacterium]
MQHGAIAVQRSVDAHGQARSAGAAAQSTQQRPVVQRVLGDASADTGGGANGTHRTPRVDPHLIAEQVYRLLKQRLMLERERAGATRSRYG